MKRIYIIFILLLELFLFIYPKEVINEFRNTINICLYSLMPTMFYSIIFSNILLMNNIEEYIPNFLTKIFKLNKKDISIIILSILSGYPNNIRLLINNENEYLNYCTNFINPLFFIGTVGSIYLNNIKFSIIILICHYISNIIMIIMFKNKLFFNQENKSNIINNIYNKSLKNTINTLVIIISNLLFISIIVSLLKLILPFKPEINSFILGILEFSKGIYELNLCNIDTFLKGLFILIIITFGSISIHLQVLTINPKIKYIKFLKYRILNVFISILIYLIIMSLY